MRITGTAGVITAFVAAGAALSACGTPASTAARPAAATAAARPAAHHARPARARSAAAARAEAAASAAAVPAATPAKSSSPKPAAVTRLPAAGNPGGHAFVPVAARAVNTSHPNHVIGRGTPAGCTSAAVVRAVAAGGITTFNCGPNPVTINMRATARVHNISKRVVLDGGGKVVLSGMDQRRILYMNTCDKSLRWITDHCQDQATPTLVVQNLTLTAGKAPGHNPKDMVTGSGGAIYAQGGQLKVVNSRLINNFCYAHGPDLGGAAIRAWEQYSKKPVYVVHSTFTGGFCSNGGALSSLQVSWVILNSLFGHNHAIGFGQNPTDPGTLGGGSGGAMYTDGDTYNVTFNGDLIRFNRAREGGGAVFYVSNDHSGQLFINNSTLHANPSGGFHNFPGTIFYLGRTQNPAVSHSHLDG